MCISLFLLHLICDVLLFVTDVFLNFCLCLWQPDPSAAFCSELKYAYTGSKSFKKYMFEFNKNYLSYRKAGDKVGLGLMWLAVQWKCIRAQDLTVCIAFSEFNIDFVNFHTGAALCMLIVYVQCVSEKRHSFYFCDVRCRPILLIFGRSIPERICSMTVIT